MLWARRGSFMAKPRCIAALVPVLCVMGCHGSTNLLGDARVDPGVEPGVDAPYDVPPDRVPPEVIDTGPVDVDEEPPPNLCTDPPPDGPVGRPCISDIDCAEDLECWPETIEVYDGEAYVAYLGGYCARARAGDGACIPHVPDSCPRGALCFRAGYDPDERPVHACMDECAPADEYRVPFDDNCGCREGYQCWFKERICVPGCSNDRQCCEVWDDEDEDGERDEGEVTLVEDCTSICDDDGGPGGAATYRCTNPGSPGARFGDPCDHHSGCPRDGLCLRLIDPVVFTVEYPGGYCYKERCDLVGRGCGDLGGCVIVVNARGEEDHNCVKPCHTGTEPGDGEHPCRSAPADQREACIPAVGYLDSTDADGMCWTGSFNDVTTENLGAACSSDEDCYSPLGLGECWNVAMEKSCSIRCNEHLEADLSICGPAGSAVCWKMTCLAACDTPGGALGANGCPYPDLACYPAAPHAADIIVPRGSVIPPGICLPACPSDAWCGAIFSGLDHCNTTSGMCTT
jgi:hypothetical protein